MLLFYIKYIVNKIKPRTFLPTSALSIRNWLQESSTVTWLKIINQRVIVFVVHKYLWMNFQKGKYGIVNKYLSRGLFGSKYENKCHCCDRYKSGEVSVVGCVPVGDPAEWVTWSPRARCSWPPPLPGPQPQSAALRTHAGCNIKHGGLFQLQFNMFSKS